MIQESGLSGKRYAFRDIFIIGIIDITGSACHHKSLKLSDLKSGVSL